jgi:hypothetical protein
MRLEIGSQPNDKTDSEMTRFINKDKDLKTIQGLLRHAKASTTLDLYSQAIDESKLAAQREIALAILEAERISAITSTENHSLPNLQVKNYR